MAFLKQIYCGQNDTCLAAPLKKRKIIKKILTQMSSIIFIFIFIAFFFAFISSVSNGSGFRIFSRGISSYLFFFIFIVLCQVIYECFYYRYYFYNLTNQEVIIRKGVVSRGEVILPYSKIQNVFVDQDFFDRIFGLYDVNLETAGSQSGLVAHIDGINKINANNLKELIMNRVKQQHSFSNQNGL